MAEVASHAQPHPILTSSLAVSPPTSIGLPRTVKNAKLTLDTMSPVTQNGSFEFDRIIKSGQVLKRTRKTKSWKPIFLVLRPNLLSIYRDKTEAKLRHQINLSDLTAVARQKDPKRKDKYIFGLFSPSRNYHLEATSEREAQEWVELIRRGARMDQEEEEIYLASPGGARSAYQGFGRSIDAIAAAADERGGYSSSDMEAFTSSHPPPKQRGRGNTGLSDFSAGRPSQIEYSGPDQGSYSDLSDDPTARLSTLSLAYSEARPSTSSAQRSPQNATVNSVYGSNRPALNTRTHSQLSMSPSSPVAPAAAGTAAEPSRTTTQSPRDDERVLYHGYLYLLKSKSGVRRWNKLWVVLRPKALALYKTEEEYTAVLILPVENVIDVVEIDAISKSKTSCMQVISEERNYRFCAADEEALARWLGAFKSLLSKRKTGKEGGRGGGVAVGGPGAVQTPGVSGGVGIMCVWPYDTPIV